MVTAFVLTMPRAGSWNGKWSQEDKIHIIKRDIPANVRKDLIARSPFCHRWDDGWVAQIDVVPVSSVQKQIDKSVGFAGYTWMVDSLIKFGEIYYPRDWPEVSKSK